MTQPPRAGAAVVNPLRTMIEPQSVQSGEHAGWDYLSMGGLSLTASETTLYIMQSFCCVESRGENAGEPIYDDVVQDYLERINDDSAAIPDRWR